MFIPRKHFISLRTMAAVAMSTMAALAAVTLSSAATAQAATTQQAIGLEEGISIAFSVPVDHTSVNERSVVVFGPRGVVRGALQQNGDGYIFRPLQQLQPDAKYTVFVDGVVAASGDKLSFATWSVTTRSLEANLVPASKPAVAGPSAEWIPGPDNLDGSWRTAWPHVTVDAKAAPKAASGVTALSGRVLRIDGTPLPGVSLTIDGMGVRSDRDGYFIVEGIQSSGSRTLVIDGASASTREDRFGYYEALVDVAAGRTTVLPYVIWMSKLDARSSVRFASPTRDDVVLRSDRMPGLEIRVPKGSVLRDRQGRVVNELSITPIPLDRSPFPQPPGDFPVYFTVQPGGVTVSQINGQAKPIEVVYPNYSNLGAGTKTNAWLYDPFEKGWHTYGQGTVDPTGEKIVMDAGVGFYQLTGGAHTSGTDPKQDCPCGGGSAPPGKGNGSSGGGPKGKGSAGASSNAGAAGSEQGGDPVSLSTGILIQEAEDMSITDINPITVNRVYRHTNTNLGTFGYGWMSALDIYLYTPTFETIYLVLPNGSRIEYNLILEQNGRVYRHTKTPGIFFNSTVRKLPQPFWSLVLQDGTEYRFTWVGSILTSYADRHGNTTQITRDGNGRITRVTGPTGRFLDFTLNTNGTVSTIKNSEGHTVSYAYQSGYLQSVTDPAGGVTSFTYDSNNRLRTVTDAANNLVATHDYDANGRVSMQTFANGQTMQFAYTVVNGAVVQTDVTDQRGKVRRVLFDSERRVVGSTYPYNTAEEQISTFTYNGSTGQLQTMTDPLSRTTSYAYDGYGNVSSITRMYGTSQAATMSYTYEPFYQQLATVTDPLNHTWTYGFDAARNPTTLTDPLNHVTTYGFDSRGRVTTVTDANNHTWTYGYNGADLSTVTDPLGQVTQIFTNSIGQVTHTVNPAGEISRNEYDSGGRLKKVYDGLGQNVEFVFNTAGQMTAHKDQKGNTTIYTYNNLGLVDTKTDALLNSESYAYGANGMLSRITDRKGQVTGISYDYAQRVSQVGFGATTASPTAYTSTIGYTYDDGDRATALTDSVNGNIGRTYDDFDRLTQEVTAEGTVNYTYDAAGRRATMTVAGQTQVVYTWDNANRLTHITQGMDVVQFGYDNANRRTSTTLPNGVLQSYGYDNANQLVSITYTKGAATIGDLQYTYDLTGRRVKVSGTMANILLPAAVAYATYNVNNQLTSWAGTSHTYDLNGNLTYDGSKTFTWNARDELSGLSGGVTASFAYDAAGRRRSKTIGSSQTGFVYDQLNFVQELSGIAPAANLLTGALDELFLRRDSSANVAVFYRDSIGSVIAASDSTGTVNTEYIYDPYGVASTVGAANANSQQFTAREQDVADLIFMRARFYIPSKARFLSEDPIGLLSGQANSYSYVGGNPTNFRDPFGLWRWPGDVKGDAEGAAQGSGLPGEWNGPQDAYRHCVASCEMTRENGRFIASCLGWINEKAGDWFKKQQQGERNMDDANNAAGFTFGESARSFGQCKAMCMTGVRNNTLVTSYRRNTTAPYSKAPPYRP